MTRTIRALYSIRYSMGMAGSGLAATFHGLGGHFTGTFVNAAVAWLFMMLWLATTPRLD